MVLSLTTQKIDPGVTVIEIDGRITIGRESSRIEVAVLKALNEGARKIVIDLARVSAIDSTGMGIIAYCFGKASQAGAQLHASGAHGRVMEVFQITHIDQVIQFFPDTASAGEAFVKTFSAA